MKGGYFKIYYLAVLAVLLVAAANYWAFRRLQAPEPAAPETAAFSDNNLVEIRYDTLKRLLENTYHENVAIAPGEREVTITLSGRQANSAFFYNSNRQLLSVTDKGFRIQHVLSPAEQVIAVFTLKKEHEMQYVSVPGDVLIPLASPVP